MRRLLLWLVYGRRATPRGIAARAIEDALRADDLGLSRSECRTVTHRVMATLDQLGFRL